MFPYVGMSAMPLLLAAKLRKPSYTTGKSSSRNGRQGVFWQLGWTKLEVLKVLAVFG